MEQLPGIFFCCWTGLSRYRNRFLFVVDVFHKNRESDKEGNTDEVFYPFDVGVVIHQSVELLHHSCGEHVLAHKFANLLVHLIECSDECCGNP